MLSGSCGHARWILNGSGVKKATRQKIKNFCEIKYNEEEIADDFWNILDEEEKEDFANLSKEELFTKWGDAIINRTWMCRGEHLYKVKRKDLFEVGNIGSRNDTTHYFIEDNRIICGCFDDSLEEFEEEVKDFYKLRPSDRINKMLDTIELLQTFMTSFK